MKENENQEPSNMAGAAKGGNTSEEIVGSAVSAAVGEPVATSSTEEPKILTWTQRLPLCPTNDERWACLMAENADLRAHLARQSQAKPVEQASEQRLESIREFGDSQLFHDVRTGQIPIHTALERIESERAAIAHSAAQAPQIERAPIDSDEDQLVGAMYALRQIAAGIDDPAKCATSALAVIDQLYSATATPAAPTCTPADEQTEQIRLAYADPTGRSKAQMVHDVECLLAHIALLRTPDRAAQGAGTAPVGAADRWTCFHCGESFTDRDAARLHFGRTERQGPICEIDQQQYREMESRMEAYNAEDADIHHQMAAMGTKHQQALRRAEEEGYAKGLRDAARFPADATHPAPVSTAAAPEAPACAGCDPAEGFCRACREAERKAAPEAPATEQQSDLVGNLKLALQRVKSSSLLVEARQFANVGLALIDVQGKATEAPATEQQTPADIDHHEWASVHRALVQARDYLQKDGSRHSWLDGDIAMAAERSRTPAATTVRASRDALLFDMCALLRPLVQDGEKIGIKEARALLARLDAYRRAPSRAADGQQGELPRQIDAALFNWANAVKCGNIDDRARARAVMIAVINEAIASAPLPAQGDISQSIPSGTPKANQAQIESPAAANAGGHCAKSPEFEGISQRGPGGVWLAADGRAFGEVSDEQVEVVLMDALADVRKRSGLGRHDDISADVGRDAQSRAQSDTTGGSDA